MRKMKHRDGALAVKIDLEKASPGLRLLELTLGFFGFSAATIKLIMSRVSLTSFTVLWNGEKLPSIVPHRGIRQGDLHSRIYLFCV